MSVYIRGMEMPKSCGYCPIRHLGGDGDECFLGAKITEYQTRPEDCPLIPVPDHGRLIDADALEYEEAYLNGHYELGDFEIVTREDIESAPTITPAEKGG